MKPSRWTAAVVVAGMAAAGVALSVAHDGGEVDNGVTAPVSEFGVRMAECLAGRGWDVTPTQGNSYSVQSDAAESGRLSRDRDECGKQVGYDVYGKPAGRAQ